MTQTSPITEPFPSSFTLFDLKHLHINDAIDHRDNWGRFALATIIGKPSGHFKIHYQNYSDKWDTWSTYQTEFGKFAPVRSISRRPAHRLTHLKAGDFVDVKPPCLRAWTKGKIHQFDPNSGQIQVIYRSTIASGCQRAPTVVAKCKTWVHLDNVKEVDAYGTYTFTEAQQKAHSLSEWLQTRRIVSNTPEHLKTDCVKEIIDQVFDGSENVIDFFIKHGTPSQLHQMRHIIQEKTRTFKEFTQDMEWEDEEQELEDTPKISSFDELPEATIQYICGYLDDLDVRALKRTSYKNCVVCLKEQKKTCAVGVFDTNKMINGQDQTNGDLAAFKRDKLTFNYTRYLPTASFLYLSSECERMFGIGTEHQLFITMSPRRTQMMHFHSDTDMHSVSIAQIADTACEFCLLDARNTIIFDSINYSLSYRLMDNWKPLVDSALLKVVLLKWFDMFFQQIITLQFVIVNPETVTFGKLLNYVEDGFIATTTQQKIWYRELTTYIKKMNAADAQTNEGPLIIHRIVNGQAVAIENVDTKLFEDDSIPVFVVQLNPKHSLLSASVFQTINDKYSTANN